jgi:hypothetical protein
MTTVEHHGKRSPEGHKTSVKVTKENITNNETPIQSNQRKIVKINQMKHHQK